MSVGIILSFSNVLTTGLSAGMDVVVLFRASWGTIAMTNKYRNGYYFE